MKSVGYKPFINWEIVTAKTCIEKATMNQPGNRLSMFAVRLLQTEQCFRFWDKPQLCPSESKEHDWNLGNKHGENGKKKKKKKNDSEYIFLEKKRKEILLQVSH